MLIGAATLAIVPGSASLAQGTSLVGDWTGRWDGTYFVEYKIIKASRNSLSAYYGYKPQADGPTRYELITCNAVTPGAYNCGATSLVFTSAGSADATMHAQNGKTLTTSLSR